LPEQPVNLARVFICPVQKHKDEGKIRLRLASMFCSPAFPQGLVACVVTPEGVSVFSCECFVEHGFIRSGELVAHGWALPAATPCILLRVVACVQVKDALVESVEFPVPGLNILRRVGEQASLFDRKKYSGVMPQTFQIEPPTSDSTVLKTIPAYYTYLRSGGYSKYTPDDFSSDVKKFGLFVKDRKLREIRTVDIQQWIGALKKVMTEKTVSRKISALTNYFLWLATEKVLTVNPAASIRYLRVTSPLPDILFESECQKLLTAASNDPRTYVLVLLLLETGIKKEELFDLKIIHFDLSNKYAPEFWVKHSDKKVWKDRKLKLPPEIVPVFADYVAHYTITDILFPYTPRFVEMLLTDTATKAGLQKKVTAGILRDTFVVRSLKRGEGIEDVLKKIGLSETTWEDAKEKYEKLAMGGI
jgi:site-specific recombinase XerD